MERGRELIKRGMETERGIDRENMIKRRRLFSHTLSVVVPPGWQGRPEAVLVRCV